MVRGNWQKRVESAQARREEQRARKARKGDREAHRQMASGLMSFLASRSADGEILHVWVDSDPRKSKSGGGGGGGRAPSQDANGEFDSDDDDAVGKKRGKKGGKKQSARKGPAKKAHPRQGLKNSHHFDDDEGFSAADAQELASSREQSANHLNSIAWSLVVGLNGDPLDYERGYLYARAASTEVPNSVGFRNTNVG